METVMMFLNPATASEIFRDHYEKPYEEYCQQVDRFRGKCNSWEKFTVELEANHVYSWTIHAYKERAMAIWLAAERLRYPQ